ncbi:carcinoembryonic antigen-related cell adhesion molecule 5-like [Scleropages formosus]|uniref:carcinoembryonic antigen-related cell adhesion molecule 5-like n=1 Tax=Scleropages formosus TaxID=113540 RepID=UPI0010FABC17|nr:carcinoembryonic antigen-related cell adhesion molecule 5-like [Scleropages formosus]
MRPPRTDTLLAIAVFLLLLRFRLTFAQQQCDMTAVVGDTVTIPLGGGPHPKDLKNLVWKHETGTGSLTAFRRSGGRVSRGTGRDVTGDGSLVLRDVQMSHSGQYSARVANTDGVRPVTVTLCVTKPVYGLLGADVELDPDVSETLFDISWQRGRYIVAMWYRDIEYSYYGRCETGEQCDLNNSTGVLVMKGLKAEDEGRYLAEINGKTPLTGLDLIPLKPVSKPSVTTSCNETQCILTCVGEETKHTKYSWKEDNETVKEGNTLTVEKSGEQSKSYTCVFSNPKSEEHSDPLTEMDLFPDPVSKPSVTTSCSWTHCILTCVGEETKHTKYSWKENNETVKEGNTLTVEKSGEQSKSYTCVFSNPKSEEHSDPLTQMDLFPAKGSSAGPITGSVCGWVVLFTVLVAGALIY